MNEAYEDVVTTFPPEKSPEGDAVLLKFQTRRGEVLRLRVSDAIARNLETQLLLLSGFGNFERNPKTGEDVVAFQASAKLKALTRALK